jgi:hypothetical protein
MITRRGFLKALAGTMLAPFVPAIAEQPAIGTLPFADILSGKYPLFLCVGNESGPIKSFGRRPVVFDDGVSKFIDFGVAAENCHVDRGFLQNESGSITIPFDMAINTNSVMAGDYFTVSSLTLSNE